MWKNDVDWAGHR